MTRQATIAQWHIFLGNVLLHFVRSFDSDYKMDFGRNRFSSPTTKSFTSPKPQNPKTPKPREVQAKRFELKFEFLFLHENAKQTQRKVSGPGPIKYIWESADIRSFSPVGQELPRLPRHQWEENIWWHLQGSVKHGVFTDLAWTECYRDPNPILLRKQKLLGSVSCHRLQSHWA